MKKEEFLRQLKEALSGFPADSAEETAEYYREIIEDSMEDGIPEDEAVQALGPVGDIAALVLGETSLPKLIRARVRPARALRAWEIVLIVLGFPLWFPLLAAAAAVFLAVYVVIWAVIVSLWAADLAVAVSGLYGIFYGIVEFSRGLLPQGVFYLGAGLFCAGASVLLFFAFRQLSVWTVKLSGKILLGVKALFVRKDGSK